MSTVTLELEERVLAQAERQAVQQGTTLTDLLTAYVEDLASAEWREKMDRFFAIADAHKGEATWSYNREDWQRPIRNSDR